MKTKLVAVMGPTASGKTAISVDLAERFNGEIVSVDSALVYRYLDIGSAKPDMDERRGIAHHLIDVRDPWEPFSAAEFAEAAHAAIADIAARGKLPILAGGTGLYFQAVLQGLGEMPAASTEIRAQLARRAEAEGWAGLHAELATVDPAAAARIHATDAQRIQRALEVYLLTGTPITVLQERGKDVRDRRYDALKLVVSPPERATLHARIETRFDLMINNGFLDEVARLRAMPQMRAVANPLELPAVRAVGYRQAWMHLDGLIDFTQFRERGIAATRQLAKRQFTWLRSESDVDWFDPATEWKRLDETVAEFVI